MQNVSIWVEHNPNTGSTKPYEVHWQAEGQKASVVSSCKTEVAAQKSLKRFVKFNSQYYNMIVRGA